VIRRPLAHRETDIAEALLPGTRLDGATPLGPVSSTPDWTAVAVPWIPGHPCLEQVVRWMDATAAAATEEAPRKCFL
jgi:hypothetical protein